jgi:hypothetical protein
MDSNLFFIRVEGKNIYNVIGNPPKPPNRLKLWWRYYLNFTKRKDSGEFGLSKNSDFNNVQYIPSSFEISDSELSYSIIKSKIVDNIGDGINPLNRIDSETSSELTNQILSKLRTFGDRFSCFERENILDPEISKFLVDEGLFGKILVDQDDGGMALRLTDIGKVLFLHLLNSPNLN